MDSSQEHQTEESFNAHWTLELCPLQENVYYKREIYIDLTPLQRDGKVYGIYPVFNNDGLVKTPGFHLEIQKVHSIQCPVELTTTTVPITKEQQKNSSPDQEIHIPKPLSEKKVCYVCRERYTDYLEHISHPSHKKKIKNNVFNHYVEEMCNPFRKQEDDLFAVGKRRYENSAVSVENTEGIEIKQKPTKKRFLEKSSIGHVGETGNTLHTFNNQVRASDFNCAN